MTPDPKAENGERSETVKGRLTVSSGFSDASSTNFISEGNELVLTISETTATPPVARLHKRLRTLLAPNADAARGASPIAAANLRSCLLLGGSGAKKSGLQFLSDIVTNSVNHTKNGLLFFMDTILDEQSGYVSVRD